MLRKLFAMFRKVDEVAGQADEINELLYGDEFNESDFVKRAYGMSLSQSLRLGVMIMRYQDQTLGAFGVRRLQWLLKRNPGALSYYADFQRLTAMLILYFRKDAPFPTVISASPH